MALTSTGPAHARWAPAARGLPPVVARAHAHGAVREARWLGKGRGTIHKRRLDMLRTAARRSDRVEHRADVYETVVAVARDVLSRRPRPGAVEIPIDIQFAPARPARRPCATVAAAPDATAVAGGRHAGVGRPTAAPGRGRGWCRPVQPACWLAELLGAPVLTSVEGGVDPGGSSSGARRQWRRGATRRRHRRRRRRARDRHPLPARSC